MKILNVLVIVSMFGCNVPKDLTATTSTSTDSSTTVATTESTTETATVDTVETTETVDNTVEEPVVKAPVVLEGLYPAKIYSCHRDNRNGLRLPEAQDFDLNDFHDCFSLNLESDPIQAFSTDVPEVAILYFLYDISGMDMSQVYSFTVSITNAIGGERSNCSDPNSLTGILRVSIFEDGYYWDEFTNSDMFDSSNNYTVNYRAGFQGKYIVLALASARPQNTGCSAVQVDAVDLILTPIE